ncbi:hypothetical protein GCM10027300_16410 [Modestobacter lapidis]
MAMTLRLTDEETAALRAQAEAEQRSMQDVAREAVREYVERRAHRAAVTRETAWVNETYAEALDELGRR